MVFALPTTRWALDLVFKISPDFNFTLIIPLHLFIIFAHIFFYYRYKYYKKLK